MTQILSCVFAFIVLIGAGAGVVLREKVHEQTTPRAQLGAMLLFFVPTCICPALGLDDALVWWGSAQRPIEMAIIVSCLFGFGV